MRFLMLVGFLMLAPLYAAGQVVADDISEDAVIEAALDQIRKGSIDTGVATLQSLAEAGNATAMFHVAEVHRLGVGREISIPIATMYYRFAAQLGHQRASLSLANILFFEGSGSEKEFAEALDTWQTLTLAGNHEAAYMLGMVYWNGEAGMPRDPIRGYALVWLAFQGGYSDAEQNELSMRALLSTAAKETAHEYAKNIETRGFDTKPLALNLLTQDVMATPAEEESAPEEEAPRVRPDDWTRVWRLEVGYAMSANEIERLQRVISTTQQAAVGDLYAEVDPSPNRPGLFRLLYGPAKSVNEAVSRCVALKRAGHDCFARPPEED